MAYCVNCGVKLSSGTKACPLCNTEVIASKQIIGEKEEFLFAPVKTSTKEKHPLFDKNRQGLFELIVAFMVIAIITLVITSFALKSFNPYIPLVSVVFGGAGLLVAILLKPSYKMFGSLYSAITIILVTLIDLVNFKLSWSVYISSSVFLFWLVFVLPFFNKEQKGRAVTLSALVAIPIYLLFLNYYQSGVVSWAITIAIPTYIAVLISLAVLALRFQFGKPTITDIVLSLITISSLGVVAADFFHLKSIESTKILSWSTSVAVVALTIILFLILNLTLRRVRHYFHNRVV